MSAQLGEVAGLGIAPDVLKLKTRGIYGSSVQNQPPFQGQLLPQFLGFNKGGHSGAENLLGIGSLMIASGRVKKYSIYIKNASAWTGDGNFILRKNGADFPLAPALFIPQAVSDGTYFVTDDNLDLEFALGDILNFRLFLLSGTGRYFASWSVDIEWDSDSEGEFDSDIIVYASNRPNVAAIRRNLPNHSNWVSVDPDTMAMPSLYSGSIIANAGRVATGFQQLTTHSVSASIVTSPTTRLNKLSLSWIIAETGSKLALGNESFDNTTLLNLSLGQGAGNATIEPCMGLVVARVNFP